MDKIDKHILKSLQESGRKKKRELAEEVNLAASTMLDRVRKLEASGVIKEYRAVVDAEKIGMKAQGFVFVSLERHMVKSIERFEEEIKQVPNVCACYHTAGRFDYLLHVIAKDLDNLGLLIKEKLATISGMGKIETFIVYSVVKPNIGWPIDMDDN